MLRTFRNRIGQCVVVFVIFGIAAVLPAAARSALTDESGVLQHVPDDTPYIFASGAPLPDELLDELEPRFDEMLKAYQVLLREIFRNSLAENSADMTVEGIQRTSALVDEVMTFFSIEGLRNAGIERESGLVLYGNGIVPVFRIDLGDADKFSAAIERMETAAGESMETAELDGNSYRYVGDEEARLIIGIFDGDAVFTIAPATLDDDALKLLLGLTPPKKNIARSGKLLQLVNEYDFSEHYIGYFDTLQMAIMFLDEPGGLNAVLLESAEYDAATLTDICREEIRDVAGIAPRIVVGYTEVSSDAMSGSMIVEMRKDIATGLSTLTSLVPGLGIDPGGLFSFGMSFNVPAIIAFIEARLDAMEADPFECEHFSELQAGVTKVRESLAQPLPPFITGMRGFNVIVDSLGDYDVASGQPPQQVDASVLLSMDDAQAMFMMGAMMSPELAAVDLQPDGVPVPLLLPQLQAIAQSAYAAMGETVLAVSMGTDSKTRVTEVLMSDSVEPPPVISATVDAAKYYEFIAQSSMAEPDEEGAENALSEPARIALRDAMLKVGEMYDRMIVDVRFTERGIEMDSKVTMSK